MPRVSGVVKTDLGDYLLYNYCRMGGDSPRRAAIAFRLVGRHLSSAGRVNLTINTPVGVLPLSKTHNKISQEDFLLTWVLCTHVLKPLTPSSIPIWAKEFGQIARDANVPLFVIQRLLDVNVSEIIEESVDYAELF